MMGAFLYLTLRTAWNRLVSQAKRVRQPRYALALILGALYFWFILFSNDRSTRAMGGGGPFATFTSDSGRELITLGVAILFLVGWIFGRKQDSLAFQPAEVHFLFPAPVTRRGLVIFKLLRLQLATLIGTTIWVLLVRRGASDVSGWQRAIGFWILFSSLSMHRLGAALVFNSLTQHGVAGLVRQRVVTVVLIAIALLYGYAAWSAWTAVAAGVPVGPANLIQVVNDFMSQPLLHALTEPFRVLANVSFASTRSGWVAAIPWAVLIVAGHFFWVISANTAFEESAALASERVATRVKQFREKGIRGQIPITARTVRFMKLPLAANGSPFAAIVWKNTMALLRSLRGTSMMMLPALIIIVVMSYAFREIDGGTRSGLLLAMLSPFIVLSIIFGPRMVRNDLRADLAQLSTLKTWPLSGATIVTAEVLSATLALTAIQLLATGMVLWLSGGATRIPVSGADMMLIAFGIPLALTAMNGVNMSIHNGTALMFPGWAATGSNRPAGVEAMGQMMLFAIASMLLLALSLIPAVVTGTILWFVTPGLPVRIRVIFVVLGAIVTLVTELAIAMQFLGRLLEKTEPSSEG